MQLPFSFSYLILTPRRVRLPGEQCGQAEKTISPATPPTRWLNAGAKTLRRFKSRHRVRTSTASSSQDVTTDKPATPAQDSDSPDREETLDMPKP
ncbi:hypothetical protein HMN09_00699000 [Mycena chlorophos]|uniref:Uncharacterized protein n=1 Tax=Mycena chlorophos TaxID=658473 RepID=A0A8H6T304_MYCCL|nr:hypothetical protein HMN09_00699000 [Mycena chlorophos]